MYWHVRHNESGVTEMFIVMNIITSDVINFQPSSQFVSPVLSVYLT